MNNKEIREILDRPHWQFPIGLPVTRYRTTRDAFYSLVKDFTFPYFVGKDLKLGTMSILWRSEWLQISSSGLGILAFRPTPLDGNWIQTACLTKIDISFYPPSLDGIPPVVKEYIVDLLAHLETWIGLGDNSLTQGMITLAIKKGGRKRDTLYDQAYQQILNREDFQVVFVWYCKESGITNPDKGTRDAFKAAMKYRDKKAKK